MGNRKEERNGGCSCILRFVNFTECRIKLHSESSYGLSIQGNIRKFISEDHRSEMVRGNVSKCAFVGGLLSCQPD